MSLDQHFAINRGPNIKHVTFESPKPEPEFDEKKLISQANWEKVGQRVTHLEEQAKRESGVVFPERLELFTLLADARMLGKKELGIPEDREQVLLLKAIYQGLRSVEFERDEVKLQRSKFQLLGLLRDANLISPGPKAWDKFLKQESSVLWPEAKKKLKQLYKDELKKFHELIKVLPAAGSNEIYKQLIFALKLAAQLKISGVSTSVTLDSKSRPWLADIAVHHPLPVYSEYEAFASARILDPSLEYIPDNSTKGEMKAYSQRENEPKYLLKAIVEQKILAAKEINFTDKGMQLDMIGKAFNKPGQELPLRRKF
jgi:hypothetical protein